MSRVRIMRLFGFFLLILSLSVMIFAHVLPVFSPVINSYISGSGECVNTITGCGSFLLFFFIEVITFIPAIILLLATRIKK